MTPWKLMGYVVGGLLIIAGVLAWNRHKDSQYDVAVTQWKQKLHTSDSSLAVVVAQRETVTVQNTQSIPIYLAGKTKIIHDAAGTPAETAVKACFDLADVRISKCEAARKADSLVIGAQQDKIRVLESKPEPQIPRFQPYGEALYDVANRVPVIRAGALGRIIGPVSFSVAGEYAAPPAGQSTPAFRAVAGVRVAF